MLEFLADSGLGPSSERPNTVQERALASTGTCSDVIVYVVSVV